MSTRQLRSKRTNTTSGTNQNGCAKPEPPLSKKQKRTKHMKQSESDDSSSEEFVRPSNDLKVSVGGIISKNGPSPVADFSSIEKSIFSEVSRLSDTESDDSDFEEVTGVLPSSSTDIDDKTCVIKEVKLPNALSTLEEESKDKDSKSFKKARGRPTQNAKQDLAKAKKENITQCGTNSAAFENSLKEERASRSSKRKVSEKPETSTKLLKKDQRNDKNTVKTKQSTPEKTKNFVPSFSCTKEKATKRGSKQLKEEESFTNLECKKEIPESLDNLDIAQLLVLGEGLKTSGKSSEKSDSDSDWEEVDTADVKKHEIPKEGVQITLEAPEFSWRRKKQRDQQACIEAEMNRAFNRVRKELQLLCHKTSLLLWLGHGIFINRAINSDNVKAMALSLVPNDLCPLPKAPGRKYVDQLIKWFSKEFECSEGFPEVILKKQSPPLASVLEQHFSRRYAKSTKELTFMFVTVLRALGLDSRLVISFQPMPLKPQSDELLSINSKSKRGRVAKKQVKNAEKSDDPDDPDEPPSQISHKKGIKSSKHNDPAKAQTSKTIKPARKSAPSVSEGTTKKTVQGRKSLPDSSSSKSRETRGKKPKKSYKEHTDSDENNSDKEDYKPILSPEKKIKIDKDTAERLKKAAAKRAPTNRRFASKSGVEPGPSKYFDSDDDFESRRNARGTAAKNTPPSKKPSVAHKSSSAMSDSDDSDFEVKPSTKAKSKSCSSNSPKKGRPSKSDQAKKKGVGKKVLSSDDDSGKKCLTSSGSDYWVEVYLQDEERWACVDVPSKKIDSTKEILAKASQPIAYVVAFNPNGSLKDVTKRYAPKFSQVTCKQRVSIEWWDKTLKPFQPRQSKKEAAEDSEMNLVELDRPMPKSVGECKNHPLYVLKRHLLKFEAIYPPDAPSLGFVRNEAIYARQNVYTLHSREIWMKDAKSVRLGEQPYKIVKARPKYDRLSGKTITDLPLEVFGPWQVEDYVPPPAVDGKVPRNAYGNVELFKPTMLPKGCVHLQVPGLTRVAKKLRIDCAPAVVGFDYHSGGCHPTYDGFVVCEEYVDVLMDAWNKEIDESAKRREEKHEKRVYGNWRRLIKGLLIREQLKYRYDFKGEEGEGGSESTVNPEVLKSSRITPEVAPLPSLFPKLMANIRAQKTRQRKSAGKDVKNQPKVRQRKQDQKQAKSKPRRKRKDETSEEEESDWDSTTTDEDDAGMVLLSDEDSGSEFEDLKK